MLGLPPTFAAAEYFAFRPDVARSAQAALPRCVERAFEDAAARHDTCVALPTCWAMPLRNVVPLPVSVTVWPWKPPFLSVATTVVGTTLPAPFAVRVFDEPNSRPSSLTLNFTPGTDFPIFLRAVLLRTMRTFVKRLPFDLSCFDPRPTRLLPSNTSTRQLRRFGVSARQPIVTARFTSRSGRSMIAVSGFFAFVIVICTVPVTGALCPSLTAIVGW